MSEAMLWNELKNNQLGVRFSRQIPIDRFIVDFYCKDLMLAIEIDGITHTYENQPQKDQKRQERLEFYGITFLRFEDEDVKRNIKSVINEILDWVESHK